MICWSLSDYFGEYSMGATDSPTYRRDPWFLLMLGGKDWSGSGCGDSDKFLISLGISGDYR